MSTLMQTDDNDLALAINAKGKRSLVLVKDPVIAAAIKLRNRFQFFLGEWFLDTRQGVPYFLVVLVKNPDLPVIRRLFLRIILSVKVFTTVSKMELDYDPRTRELAFTFEAIAADGRKLTGGSGEPFLVDGRPIEGQGL